MQLSHGSYGYDVMTVKDIVNSKYAVFFVVSKVHSLCMQGDKNYLNLICFLLILRLIIQEPPPNTPSTGQHVLFFGNAKDSFCKYLKGGVFLCRGRQGHTTNWSAEDGS